MCREMMVFKATLDISTSQHPCATLKPQGLAQGCTCLMESFRGMCLPHRVSLRDSPASQFLPCNFLLTSLGIACLVAFVLFWLRTPYSNDSVFLGEFNCETVIAQAGVRERSCKLTGTFSSLRITALSIPCKIRILLGDPLGSSQLQIACIGVFSHGCNLTPDKKQLKEGRVYFGSLLKKGPSPRAGRS